MIYILYKDIKNDISISTVCEKFDISMLSTETPIYAKNKFRDNIGKVKCVLYQYNDIENNDLYVAAYNDNVIDDKYEAFCKVGLLFFENKTISDIKDKIQEYKKEQRDIKIQEICSI